MKFRLLPLALATAVLAAPTLAPAPAQALDFSTSKTTGKSSLIIPIHFDSGPIGPVGVDFLLRIAPGLSDLLGPANITDGQTELSSMLFDGNLDLYYRFPLADIPLAVGRFGAGVSPYLGVRYLGVPTAEGSASLSSASSTISYANYWGLNYGARATADLPLGFSAYAGGGLTTLLTGGWNQRKNGLDVTGSGNTAAGGKTMPDLGAGISWSAANLIGFSLGYELFWLPTGLRSITGTMPGGLTQLNTVTLGIHLLFINI